MPREEPVGTLKTCGDFCKIASVFVSFGDEVHAVFPVERACAQSAPAGALVFEKGGWGLVSVR